jgi:hypothetical protein
MTAPVISLRAVRDRRLATAKADRIRELAEELEAVAEEHRDEVCAEYEIQGWASRGELDAARRMLRERL